MSNCVVYSLSDPRTLQVRYVGQTSRGLRQRFREHLAETFPNHKCHWIRSLQAKGLEPVPAVLEDVGAPELLDKAEERWIAQFRAAGARLVNATDGGGGTRGVKIPESLRILTSRKLGGRAIQDHLGRVYQTKNEAARAFGIHHQAITKVLQGKYRQAGGFAFSYVEEPLPAPPERWPDDARAAASRIRGGRPFCDEADNVYCTAYEAARKLGVNRPHIINVLRGRRKSAGGHVFRYCLPNLQGRTRGHL